MHPQREIFNKVKAHLLSQGVRSEGYSQCERAQICMYRGDKGRKCAVGAIISDEDYLPEMEGLTADILPVEYPEVFDWSPSTIAMLQSLQIIHDSKNVCYWEAALSNLEIDTFGVAKTV